MSTTRITTALLVLMLAVAACTRDNDILEDPPKPVAGKAGAATLRVTPRHHMKNIDSCTIYIKYNATVLPADYSFDDSAKVSIDNGRPVATFDSLNKGNYYLYAYGYDPVVATDSIGHIVYGGGPVTIYDSAKTYEIYLDVSEDANHIDPQ